MAPFTDVSDVTERDPARGRRGTCGGVIPKGPIAVHVTFRDVQLTAPRGIRLTCHRADNAQQATATEVSAYGFTLTWERCGAGTTSWSGAYEVED